MPSLEINPKRRRVLVVEDEETSAEPLLKLLKHGGHDAAWARHGGEALDMLEEVVPDLVMLDIIMPVVDGFAFLEQLRAQPRWKNLPVIVLTGAGPGADVHRLSELGVCEVLLKGAVDYHRLLHRLGSADDISSI